MVHTPTVTQTLVRIPTARTGQQRAGTG